MNDETEPSPLTLTNFYLILPRGAHNAQSDGTLTLIDDEAMQSVMDTFEPDVLLDFGHDSLDPEKSSIAAGWITQLENTPQGIFALIRFTDAGREAVLGGRYRFVSPFCEVECLDDNVVQPVKLKSCALTNRPGLEGIPPLIDLDTVENRIREQAVLNRRDDDYLRGDAVLLNRTREQQQAIDEENRRTGAKLLHDISVSSIPGLNYHTELPTPEARSRDGGRGHDQAGARRTSPRSANHTPSPSEEPLQRCGSRWRVGPQARAAVCVRFARRQQRFRASAGHRVLGSLRHQRQQPRLINPYEHKNSQ